MPVEAPKMEDNERFRQMVHSGSPKVLLNLLTELGPKDAKDLIEECSSDDAEPPLILGTKKAVDGQHKKDHDFIQCCQVLLKYGADPNQRDALGKTALHWASGHKNVTLVKMLLESGANPALCDGMGFNSLHCAVTAGSVDCVKMMLEQRKELVNKYDESGVTPVLTAVQRSEADILQVLVTSGGDVNVQERTSRRTPLHYALYLKKKELFEYLLNNGADLTKTDHRGTNIVHRCCAISDPCFLKLVLSQNSSDTKKSLKMEDNEGATPVIVACQNGNIQQLRMLVEAGAPVANKDKFRRCALHHCVENTDTECAEYLLRSVPSLLTCADEEGLTPLHMAVIAGNIPLIKLLLKRGANLKAVDNERHTVAHWATVCGHSDVLDLLLENGADIDSSDKHHAYPIHYAAQMMSKKPGSDSSSGGEGSLQILKTLLKHKVSSEAEDKDKRTPIIWAASAGSPEACRVLVDHGADVNRADKDDLTALHCAASRGHAACVETLIKNCKAEVDPVDKNQCTPLFYATTLGHVACIKTLLELGADITHTDTRGRTAAHCATVSGSTEALEVLRENKVNLWARNLKGDQPLHEAAQSGHLDVVQYLLTHNNGNPHAIDSGNNDGRTCLHIAALTNNIWLCKFLLERQANVNAVMKNKGKYYSPYDAALIKGHTEAKDILYAHNGRPGSAVTGHAAQTIQVKYKYHKKRKTQTAKGDKERQKSPGGKGRKSSAKSKSETAEKEVEQAQEGPPKEPEKKEVKDDAQAVKNEDTVEVEGQGQVSGNVDKKEKKEESKPKYVDKATQITTTKASLRRQRSKAAADSGKVQKEEETKSKELSKDSDQTGSKKDSESNDSKKESSSTESSTVKEKDSLKKDTAVVVAAVAENSTKSPEKQQKSSQDESKTQDKQQKQEVQHKSAHKDSKHRGGKARAGGNTSQSEDEGSHSERSSSHGNTSDIESSSSDFIRQRVKVRKSPITRGARYNRLKQQSQDTKDKKFIKPKPVGNLNKDSGVKHKSVKSSSDDNARIDKTKQTFAEKDTTRQGDLKSQKDLPAEATTADAGEINQESHTRSSKQGQGDSEVHSGASNSESKVPTPDKMGASKTKVQQIHPVDNGHDKGKTTKDKKKHDKKNVKYSSSSDGLHLDTDHDNDLQGQDNEDTGEAKKRCQPEDDQGYTDVEDMAEQDETQAPRRKKTRPNKLIQSVQESVKRYETERRSIMQLHQIRRAQIYSGPVNDVALFRKIVDNVKHNKQNGETTNAESWEEYLQTQMKIIQEDRAKSAGSKKVHNNTSQDGQDSNRSNTGSFPQPHPSHRREKTTLDGRTPRQHGAHLNSNNSSSKNNTARSDTNLPIGRLGRAQTAHVLKTSSSSPHRGANENSVQSEEYYYEDPLRFSSREAVRRRHELAQQQLIKAYRPFGGAELLFNSTSPTRPATRGRRPTSTMSSKTTTSVGSAASVRQTRNSSGYTIMTAYGTRRVRKPPDVEGTSYSRKRNPLLFQDPDTYERSRKQGVKDGSPPRKGQGHRQSLPPFDNNQGAQTKNGHR